jgi:hypothetical protein
MLIEQGSPLPRIDKGKGGGNQVELVHRKGLPITQRNPPTQDAVGCPKSSGFLRGNELQKHLVNQCRDIERTPRSFVTHLGGREVAKLVVHLRQEFRRAQVFVCGFSTAGYFARSVCHFFTSSGFPLDEHPLHCLGGGIEEAGHIGHGG